MTGFEPATTRPPDVYSNRAELHPEVHSRENLSFGTANIEFFFYSAKPFGFFLQKILQTHGSTGGNPLKNNSSLRIMDGDRDDWGLPQVAFLRSFEWNRLEIIIGEPPRHAIKRAIDHLF